MIKYIGYGALTLWKLLTQEKSGKGGGAVRYRKVIAVLAVLAVILTTLTGCFRITADDLYSLPQPSKEYLKLQQQINTVLDTGAEYSPPTAGPNRQSVQLKDIDSDGKNEAIAFFRTTGDKPLRIYIMKQANGDYATADVIQGDGAAIESIRYADMDGDGSMELIVGWQMSAALLHMTIYSVKGGQPVILAEDDYTELVTSDLDGDGNTDVLALRLPSSEPSGQANLFSLRSDGEPVTRTVRLSKGIEAISHVLKGSLSDETPAIFVESSYSGSNVITDILTCRYGSLYNITVDSASGVSGDTLRSYAVYSADINNDGVMEIPFPKPLPSPTDTKYYVIDWYTYNKYGYKKEAFSTYHDFSDGWYLVLPEDWRDSITVRREDSVAGERTLIFSYLKEGSQTPVDFLKIYTLSGDNKEDRAKLSGRFILLEHGETIFAAEILPAGTGLSVSKTQIMSSFKLLYLDWTTGIVS
jgi:hypothetical protein